MFKKIKVFYLTSKLVNAFNKIEMMGYKIGPNPVYMYPDMQAEIICLTSDCMFLEDKLYNLYNELHSDYGMMKMRECMEISKRTYNLCMSNA